MSFQSNSNSWQAKYLKYKNKYLTLKNQLGRGLSDNDEVRDRLFSNYDKLYMTEQKPSQIAELRKQLDKLKTLSEFFTSSVQKRKVITKEKVGEYNRIIGVLRNMHKIQPYYTDDSRSIPTAYEIDLKQLKTVHISGKFNDDELKVVEAPQPLVASEAVGVSPLLVARAVVGEALVVEDPMPRRAAVPACSNQVEVSVFTDFDELRDRIMTLPDDAILRDIIRTEISPDATRELFSKLVGFKRMVSLAQLDAGAAEMHVKLDLRKVDLRSYSSLYNDAVNKLKLFRVGSDFPFKELKQMNRHNGQLYSRVKVPKERRFELDMIANEKRDFKEEQENPKTVFLHASKRRVFPFSDALSLFSTIEYAIRGHLSTAVKIEESCLETHWGCVPLVQRHHSSQISVYMDGQEHLNEFLTDVPVTNYVTVNFSLRVPNPDPKEKDNELIWNSSSESVVRPLLLKNGRRAKEYFSYRDYPAGEREAFQHLIAWQDAVKEKFKSGFLSDFKYIECPDPGCSMHSGFLIDMTEPNEIMQCDRHGVETTVPKISQRCHGTIQGGERGCRMIFCRRCSKEYHGIRPCETPEFIAERDAVVITLKKAGLDYKLCINCGSAIIRESGCNFMHCNCGSDMCWICGLKITDKDPMAPRSSHRYHPDCGLWENSNAIARRLAQEAQGAAAAGPPIVADEERLPGFQPVQAVVPAPRQVDDAVAVVPAPRRAADEQP